MKIGFVVPKLSGGGAEYVAFEWASYLTGNSSDVYIFCTQPVDVSPENGFRVVNLGGTNFVQHVKSLKAALATLEIDLLIGVMPYWNLLAILAAKTKLTDRTKIVASSHTIESRYGADRGRGFALQTLLAGVLYRYADAFIASSHPVAAEAVAKYKIRRDRLWVVPNPVFPVAVQPDDLAVPGAGDRAEVPDVIVVPGRLVDQKRPELAIEVAAAIGELKGISPQVWFVGDGPASGSLKEKADTAGIHATFISWEAGWPSLLPPSAVVLLPSMLEGFGNVLLDAAAAGFPVVVSSKALGVADAVVPGVTGVLITGDSVMHYVDGVLDARSVFGEHRGPITRWLNRFTRENSGSQLNSIIASLSPAVSE